MKHLTPSLLAVALAFSFASAAQAATLFDPNTPGLSFTGDPAFNATDGTYIYVNSGGSGYADNFNLPAGKYLVSAYRTTNATGNTAYNVNLGGTTVIRDYAVGDGSDQVYSYLGYYISPGTPTVGISDGGPSIARLRDLSFTLTDSVYFDENSSGLSFSGGGSAVGAIHAPAGRPDTLMNAAGNNAMGIAQGGFASGAVTLEIGQTYEVFVSRQMAFESDGTSFSLSLGGNLFANVSGNTVDVNMGEAYQVDSFGYFTATSGSVAVLIDGAGSSFGRLDYVQFVAVPEPVTAALAMFGGIAVLLVRRRRRL